MLFDFETATTDTQASTGNTSADQVSQTQHTVALCGSALLLVPWTYYLGVMLLLVAWPLSFDSVRRHMQMKIIYVSCDQSPLTEEGLLFFQRAKALGTKLIVGMESKSKDGSDYEQRRRQVLMLSCVDACIDAAPPLSSIDSVWMEKCQLDVLCVRAINSKELKKTTLKSGCVMIVE